MKQYVIDELRPEDYEKIKSYMDENFGSSALDGIYRVLMDQNMLSDVQAEHVECQPFYFAIDLEPNLLSCELLVRAKNRMRCSCIGYATDEQRDWILRFVDTIFERFEIKI